MYASLDPVQYDQVEKQGDGGGHIYMHVVYMHIRRPYSDKIKKCLPLARVRLMKKKCAPSCTCMYTNDLFYFSNMMYMYRV